MQKFDSFAYYLNKYLSVHLPGERGLSTNSILSYRDAFVLFLTFLKETKGLKPEHLQMSFLTRDLIIEFANWLENSRKSSVSSRNQRIGTLRAFCKWLAYENPEYLKLSGEISDLRFKKAAKPVMTYLSTDAMQYLLSQPDSSTREGLRDLVLIALIYDTGARVSEIINLKFEDIRFESPSTVTLTGKGNKSRIVPLMPKTVQYLNAYIKRWNINLSEIQQRTVFTNRSGKKYTRAGIKYILDKYVFAAKQNEPSVFPEKISPHSLRHSKAMHLLQAGVNVVYIRDILGHSNLDTTERYARADTKMKREALDKAVIPMPDTILPINEDPLDFVKHSIEDDMSAWLKNISS